MKYRIDTGDPASSVALAICDCGWRGLATSTAAALGRLAAHENIVHPQDTNVNAALRKQQSRAKTR